ncbi:hypothetical protein LTR17_003257 [Elasticomyces elasticus]|nr:hypothetical protein LTR17_003257 [Elasticomyces elasticus]
MAPYNPIDWYLTVKVEGDAIVGLLKVEEARDVSYPHRGAASLAHPCAFNNLQAWRNLIRRQAEFIEYNLELSQTNVNITYRDGNVDRKLIRGPTADSSLEQFESFESGRHRQRRISTGEKIPKIEDSHSPSSHVASKKRKQGKAFKKTQTIPPEPILHANAHTAAPIQISTSISMVFMIVHTFEPYHGQILARYKLGDSFFDHTVKDAPVTRVSVPQTDGTTDDVWLCAKTECEDCDKTAHGYTDLTAEIAKKHGMFNMATKQASRDKSIVDPSAYEAFAPINLAFNYAMATAVSQLGTFVFVGEEWNRRFEDNDDGARAQTESVGDQEWMDIDA